MAFQAKAGWFTRKLDDERKTATITVIGFLPPSYLLVSCECVVVCGCGCALVCFCVMRHLCDTCFGTCVLRITHACVRDIICVRVVTCTEQGGQDEAEFFKLLGASGTVSCSL